MKEDNPSFGFGKAQRLLNSDDFEYLRKDSQAHHERSVSVYFKPSRKEDSPSRLGLSVSRKVANAVVRNQIKRKFREEFRQHQIKDKALDLLFVVRPHKNTSQLVEESFQAFQKLCEKLNYEMDH